MLRLGLVALALLSLPLAACTVTPIQLPFSEGGVGSPRDAAARVPDRAVLDAGWFANDSSVVVPRGDAPCGLGDAGPGDARASDAGPGDARGDGRVDGQKVEQRSSDSQAPPTPDGSRPGG